MNIITLTEKLDKHNNDFVIIHEDAKNYLLSLRKITCLYIDTCHSEKVRANTDDLCSHCYAYITKLYEASRINLPDRLNSFITSLSDLNNTASTILSGKELLDFYEKVDSTMKYCSDISNRICCLNDSIIPDYLVMLADSVEQYRIKSFINELPFGFIAKLDAIAI